MAHLRAGRALELERTPVDLVAIAREQVASYQQAADAHRLRLETAEGELIGQLDRARIGRVLANLLNNAVKYSPNGEIVVRLDPGVRCRGRPGGDHRLRPGHGHLRARPAVHLRAVPAQRERGRAHLGHRDRSGGGAGRWWSSTRDRRGGERARQGAPSRSACAGSAPAPAAGRVAGRALARGAAASAGRGSGPPAGACPRRCPVGRAHRSVSPIILGLPMQSSGAVAPSPAVFDEDVERIVTLYRSAWGKLRATDPQAWACGLSMPQIRVLFFLNRAGPSARGRWRSG